MATIIPDLDPREILNDGESRVYAALRKLPPKYTVFYSYTYRTVPSMAGDEDVDFGEADFVVVCPTLGYLVLEVKQGKIGLNNGVWYEEKTEGQIPLAKDPVQQARKAMFAILNRYKDKSGNRYFPLKIRFALWFPEGRGIWGDLPADLDGNGVLLEPDLDEPEQAFLRAFGAVDGQSAVERDSTAGLSGIADGGQPETERYEAATERSEAIRTLIDRVLAPRFRTFERLDQEIERRRQLSEHVLTEEQERILEETELDKQKVFLGAAGTGKTFLAIEKARRLAKLGRKVFLTCFNKNLAAYMSTRVPREVTCRNFHDYLERHLALVAQGIRKPDNSFEHSRFYDETLPSAGFEYFAYAPNEAKFDSIIVDEGQDFHADWFDCLRAMLRNETDGEFYVFADPNQDIFNVKMEGLRKLRWSKHRLTRNLRNSEPIGNWIGGFVKEGRLRPATQGGIPVVQRAWESPEEEKKLIETEVGRLVSQGIKPARIVILSPNTQEHSSLRGCDRIKEWTLENLRDLRLGPNGHGTQEADTVKGDTKHKPTTGSAIKFATIRSFKGLEADVVFLIGLREGNHACTDADVYVGGSRARFLLYVFYSKSEPPRGIR